jgi:histidyl-tRNA synthetase
MIVINAPRGIKDRIPPEEDQFLALVSIAEKHLGQAGFKKVGLPIFESASLFTRSIGVETDIVEKEMYLFEDKGGERFALRPEGTASLLRLAIQHHLIEPARITRLSYQGPMFRHERPQAGRLRQFHQVGAEILGTITPQDNIDLLVVIDSISRELKLPGTTLFINNMGCSRCRPVFRKALVEYLETHQSGLCTTCKKRTETNPLRVLDCKVEQCQPVIERAPSIIDFLCESSRLHHEAVCSGLRSLSIPFTVNPRLVRGLDYYTETTFEFVSDALGSQSTWAAGGQYDGLIGQLEGPDVPGAGFAIGVERLALLAEKAGTLMPAHSHTQDISILPLGELAVPIVQSLIREIRNEGISATGIFGTTKIKQGFKQAERDGSRFLLILGEDEMARREIVVKDLLTGEQTPFPLSPLAGLIGYIRSVRSQEKISQLS